MKTLKTNKILFYTIILSVFAVMLVFNFLTPIVSDDYAHYFGTSGTHPTSIPEIVRCLAKFRNETNGRVVSHFFVYLFLLFPKWVFNIVNAAAAALLPWLMYKYFKAENPISNALLLLSCIFALWYFMQSFGQVFLWLTGACNYLWGLCLFFLLIYPFYCEYLGLNKKFNTVLLCILALFTGAYSECGSAATGFVIAILTLLIWIKNKAFPLKQFVVCVFALIGFVFLMTAPATGTRTGTDYMRNIWFIRVCLKDYSMILIITYAVLAITAIVLKVNKRILLFSIVLVLAGFLSIATFVFAAYLPARSFFVINSFLILACLCLLSEIGKGKYKAVIPILTAALAIMFFARFIPGAKDIVQLNEQAAERNRLAETMQNQNVKLKAYTANTMYPAVYEEELTDDANNWYNDLVGKYHGFASVVRSE